MLEWLQGHASTARRGFALTMGRVYDDQFSKMHRVRFFKFPHWSLGQCENLISERFCECPSIRVVATALCALGAGFHWRCAHSQCCERVSRDIQAMTLTYGRVECGAKCYENPYREARVARRPRAWKVQVCGQRAVEGLFGHTLCFHFRVIRFVHLHFFKFSSCFLR